MNRSTVLVLSSALFAGAMLSSLPAPATFAAALTATASGDPVNGICPMGKGEVDNESPTRQFKGQTIGFCCPGCEKKWDKKTDDEKLALLATHAPEVVAAINAGEKPARDPAPKTADAPGLAVHPAVKIARAYLEACGKADAAALDSLFLDRGRATVSENASDEGSWEAYRDHHLMPELKEMPGFAMNITNEDVQTFGTTSIVRHIGTFTLPDSSNQELTKKYLAAVTYVIVDDNGSPKIAHLHWSSRAEKKPGTKAQADGATINDICPMTGDKVNTFHTREYNGLKVGFCDGDCAMRWDGLSEDVRPEKLAAAIAGTTEKTPHGAQHGDGHDHEHK